jgi:integrase
MDGERVVASFKAPTSPDVMTGVSESLNGALTQSGVPAQAIDVVMLGTTHFTNAVVQRRGLAPTAAVRLGLPATEALPPMVDWPPELREAIGNRYYFAHGGHEFDGRVITPLDPDELRRIARDIAKRRIRTVAITSVFSPVNTEVERQAGEIIAAAVPGAHVTLSSDIGRIGLLERENAAIMNARLRDLSKKVMGAFRAALDRSGIKGRFFLTQNDGTLMDAGFAERFPVLTSASGPTNSMRGAAQIAAEIIPALGQLKVANVTFADIDGAHRAITKRGRPYRANRVLALLSRMFSMAIRWHMRPDNPCKGVERNQEHKRRRYLSADELTRLIKALDEYGDQQSADIIRMLLLTGARRGEVLQARWQDIDLATSTWRKPGATTKQKTDHQLPLSSAAVQLLADLRQRVPHDAGLLFPAADGSQRRALKRDAWVSICRAASLKGARLHDLRHTYASVLASAGLSLPIIGQLLGHTTPATTARYAHLFDDPLRAAAERAGAIITGAAPAEVVPLPVRK